MLQSNTFVKLGNLETSLFFCRAGGARRIMIMLQSNKFVKLENMTTSLFPVGQVLPQESEVYSSGTIWELVKLVSNCTNMD